MFGLAVILIMGVYLLISIAVVCGMVRTARKNGRNAKLLGWSAALVMYLIPFWDWLPTVATHQYYCATEAGFWVYKTVDQWKQENPGVMETLVANKGAPSANGAYILNKRFNWVVKKGGAFPFNRWRWEQELVDVKTGEVLARYVDFSTGNGNIGGPDVPLKFWLQSEHCLDGERNNSLMRQFKDSVKGEQP
ncbi:MAG TPA: hypothetical protein PLI90_04975 [Rhodocyclaceae bacterium]|nr:hypothetical protein [Rhodocyclaceae bacterium]